MHENGKSRSSVEFFCLTIPKKIVVTTSQFQIIWIQKNFCHIMIFRRIFLSDSTEKLREEPSNVSESFKCEVSKKILNKNGISRFSIETFSAQSVETFRCGTLRYITKGRLSKNFMPKRVITLFSVDFFSRILPIKFVTESLFISESLRHRRLYAHRGASRFSVGLFRLSVLKISWVTPSTLGKFSGIETFYN